MALSDYHFLQTFLQISIMWHPEVCAPGWNARKNPTTRTNENLVSVEQELTKSKHGSVSGFRHELSLLSAYSSGNFYNKNLKCAGGCLTY